MPDYAAHYATLGVTSETDWKALRARYRRLVRKWHPDRFSNEADGKRLAEERTKEITTAYQALEQYRREFGVLPPMQRDPAPARREAPRPQGDAAPGARGEAPPVRASVRGAEPLAPRKPRKRFPRRFAVIVGALAVAAYVAMDQFRGAPQPTSPEFSEGEPPPYEPPQPTSGARPADQGPGIKVGSTFGEVIAIQGIPSSTLGDIWTYGTSRIRFSEGRVVSWDENPDSPLRIDRRLASLQRAGLFGVGSTKQEVRDIQGAPAVETETTWYYGKSKVFFKNGKVTRWEESPIQPLRAAR